MIPACPPTTGTSTSLGSRPITSAWILSPTGRINEVQLNIRSNNSRPHYGTICNSYKHTNIFYGIQASTRNVIETGIRYDV